MSYDPLDRLVQTTSNMFGTASYGYDVLDNLNTVQVSGGSQARNHTYAYDPATRRLSQVKNTVGGAVVANLTYDAQGNLASKGSQAYQFDLGNRLRSVPGQETGYEYDGHGRRMFAQTVGSGQVLSQYGNDGKLLYQNDARHGRRTDYVYLGSRLVAYRERPLSSSTATVKYQHVDALGTPVAVTNAAKTTIETGEYEPYGRLVNKPLFDGPGYTGHVQDAATGLTYMQQRYYDPLLGVFLSVDPVTAYGNPVGQFHRYRYANNNPYRFTDPDGRMVQDRWRDQMEDRLQPPFDNPCGTPVCLSAGGDGGGKRPASVSSADDLPKLPSGVSNGNSWVGEAWVPDEPHFTGRQEVRWKPIPESSWQVIYLNEMTSLLPAKRFGILSRIVIPNVRYARQSGYYGLEYQRGYRHVQGRMIGGQMQPYRDIQTGYGTLWSEETFWQVDALGEEYTRLVFELVEP